MRPRRRQLGLAGEKGLTPILVHLQQQHVMKVLSMALLQAHKKGSCLLLLR